jgi:glutamate/tyrosine decarboxylase-like PLP-dependent enzyme
LNFSRPGAQVVAQYYTFPEHRTDLAVLRIVVRSGFTHDLAELLGRKQGPMTISARWARHAG